MELQDVPEKGKNGKCSECGGSYWINRESFILRAYTVDGERYCSHCGEGLVPSTYCTGCGTLYPDYYVVSSSKPKKRARESKSIALNLSFSKVKRISAQTSRRGESIAEGRKTISSALRRQLLTVGAGIAFLAVIAVLVIFYKQNSAENKFTKEFVVALYGLKAGTEQCMKMSEILGNGNRLVDKDFARLKSVKSEIVAALQVLSPPPKKFNDVHNRLQNLSNTYDKLYSLCINSEPSAALLDSAEALNLQFTKQAKELKGTLPPQILTELKDKSIRYNNLQFMLE